MIIGFWVSTFKRKSRLRLGEVLPASGQEWALAIGGEEGGAGTSLAQSAV
jgi:hypothetical protein